MFTFRRFCRGMAVLTMLLFTACVVTGDKQPPVIGDGESIDGQLLLTLVNQARASGTWCGDEWFVPVGDVRWSRPLALAALAHSQDMHQNQFFSHTGHNGSSPGERITQVGYFWRTYGENIAKGHASEQAVIEGWFKSPGHCRNLMSNDFLDMGVGEFNRHWTQVFAAPK